MKTFTLTLLVAILLTHGTRADESTKSADTQSVKSDTTPTTSQKNSNLSISDQTADDQLTVGDLDQLMQEDPDQSQDSEFDKDFDEVAKKKNSFADEDSWMDSIDPTSDTREADSQVNGQSKAKKTLDFDEDDSSQGNIQAKIEILEITADNATSYTEMQMLVRSMEVDLHIAELGDESKFIVKGFDDRKQKLDKDSLADVEAIKAYLKGQSHDEQVRVHNELVNTMNGVSELTSSEDLGDGSLNSESLSDPSQFDRSEVSNPNKLAKEQQELQDILADSSDLKGGDSSDQKLDMGSLLKMFGGGGDGGQGGAGGAQPSGGANFMDLIKALGSEKGGAGLKGLADSFDALMKNPEMANLVDKAADVTSKNGRSSSVDYSNGLMKNIKNPMLDKLFAGNSKILEDIAQQSQKPAKKESLHDKFARETKEAKEKAKLKKKGIVLAKKPEWGGSLMISPTIEKTQVDQKTGDKDVFIDFGEGFGKEKSANKKADQKMATLQEGLDVSTLNPNQQIPVLSHKIGPYIAPPAKTNRTLVLI